MFDRLPLDADVVFFWPASLTILQCGDSLALLAVLAVPDVIGGFYSELVGRKRLQP